MTLGVKSGCNNSDSNCVDHCICWNFSRYHIKITAESHKTVEKFVLHEMEENHEFACQIYESLDKLIKKLNEKV